MSPPKRDTTPTDVPSWVVKMTEELFRLRNAMEHQSSSLNDIRSMLINERRPRSRSTHHAVQQLSTNDHASSSKTSRTRISSNDQRAAQAVRSSAVAIQRPCKPTANQYRQTVQTPIPPTKICWYHKQFGQASTNCIEPCTFTAPIIRMAPAIPFDQAVPAMALQIKKIRPAVLLEQPPQIGSIAVPPHVPLPIDSSPQTIAPINLPNAEPIASTSKSLLPADWTMSESSSSSDSDSSDASSKSQWRKEKKL